MFPDVVKAYNSNKIYKELPDMKEKQVADFCEEDEDEFANMIYQEHEQYLILKGILNLTDKDIGVRNPVLNSIAETAKANKLKLYNYFEYLLTEIQKHMDDHDICFCEDLLPWSDKLLAECRK